MGVGHQHDALAVAAQRLEEVRHVRVHVDEVGDFLLQAGDVELQFARPVIHAVPVQRAGLGAVDVGEAAARHGRRQAVALGIADGDMLLPEMVVEMQVEQRPIHVEEDGVEAVPVDHAPTSCAREAACFAVSSSQEEATTRLRPPLLAA